MNLQQLRRRCYQSPDEIMLDLGGIIEGNDKQGYYAYKDNGANILAVAHCDTLQKSKHFAIGNNIVFSSKLDNRLGVYTLLDFLPLFDINMDILLTDGEESIQSTAFYFETDKKYNWIVEFDRCGSDAVSYDYHFDEELCPYFTVSIGTFSDICELEHLGCKAFNVGVGFHDEHSFGAYFVISEYLAQINKFLRFYKDKKHIRFPHVERDYNLDSNWSLINNGGLIDETYEDYLKRKEALGSSYASPKRTGFIDSRIMQCSYCEDWFYEIEATRTVRGLSCPWCGQYDDE